MLYNVYSDYKNGIGPITSISEIIDESSVEIGDHPNNIESKKKIMKLSQISFPIYQQLKSL